MKETIEKHSFSITVTSAISALVFVVFSTASIIQMKGDLELKTSECKTGITHIVEELNKQDTRIATTELTNTEIKIKLASIDAQLANVNTSLLEIKQYFKIK